MTVLYGRNTLSADPDPEDNQASVTFEATPTYSAPYYMLPSTGSTLLTMTKTVAMTYTDVANSYWWRGTCWMSNPLSAGTISSGTWTLKIWAKSEFDWSPYVQTCSPAFTAFVWDGTSDTHKSWLVGGSPVYDIDTVINTTWTEYTLTTGTGDSRTLANGDRIGIDLLLHGITYAYSPSPSEFQSMKYSMRWGDGTSTSNILIPGIIPEDYVAYKHHTSRGLLGVGA